MQRHVQFNLMIPGPMVKKIAIVTVAFWLVVQIIIQGMILSTDYVGPWLALTPATVVESLALWQLVTYMFLHATTPFHILFNMLNLWFFGSELELRWGSRQFLSYYLLTGVGAAIFYVLGVLIYSIIKGSPSSVYTVQVVGSSGSIFALLLAYGVLFGDRQIYFFGVFPMQAKYMVAIIGGVEALSLMGAGLSNSVANLAHLGGIASGFIYLMVWTRLNQFRWRKTGETRRNLKLVVNRDKDEKGGPKYWN